MRKLLILFTLLALATPAFAQTDTPTPIPSPTPVLVIPAGEISGIAENSGNQLDSIGGSLTAPGGTSIIPDVNWALIFGYIKWLIAPPTGDELAGPFGPILAALGALLTTQIFFLGIQGVVYVVSYILTWVFWIFKLILAILQIVIAVIGAILSSPIGKILEILGL